MIADLEFQKTLPPYINRFLCQSHVAEMPLWAGS